MILLERHGVRRQRRGKRVPSALEWLKVDTRLDRSCRTRQKRGVMAEAWSKTKRGQHRGREELRQCDCWIRWSIRACLQSKRSDDGAIGKLGRAIVG